MSRPNPFGRNPACMRHAYFGVLVEATIGPPFAGIGLPLYCADCHKYMYPEGYPAKGEAGNDALPQITHYDKEAT